MTATSGRVGNTTWKMVGEVVVVDTMFGGVPVRLLRTHVSDLPEMLRALRQAHRATLPIVGWCVKLTYRSGTDAPPSVEYVASELSQSSLTKHRTCARVFCTRDEAARERVFWLERDLDLDKVTLIPVRQ